MSAFRAKRPHPDEYGVYFRRYVRLVPDRDVVVTLKQQLTASLLVLRAITEVQSEMCPTPGAWNAKQILGHLNDSERIFADRALRFARGDTQAQPGFEPLEYLHAAAVEQRAWSDLVDEFETVRRATVSLLLGFDAAAWDRRGIASDCQLSVRALAFIIAGHEREHLATMKQLPF